jgi:Frag1/DRAM/Sfk1 family
VTCRILSTVYETYLGGIPVPFFSDTGRDEPAYYVFVSGAILEATFVVATLYTVYHRMRNWLHEVREVDRLHASRLLDVLCTVGTVVGVIAQPCLVFAAYNGTSSHPKAHQAAADTFFSMSTISLLCFMTFTSKMSKTYPENDYLLISSRVKAVVFWVFLIAFLLYIPIGAKVSCPARLLGMLECFQVILHEIMLFIYV